MQAMIECRQLTKKFGHKAALDHIDLTLNDSATVGIVGPNGAGKSTLFSLLCGFLTPTSGKITLFGTPVNHKTLKGRFSILPQDANLFPGIKVETQLQLFARLQGCKNDEVKRVVSLLECEELIKSTYEILSFGQKKRVLLAQALIGDPDLIFLDEPTSGLDPVAMTEIRQLIQRLSSCRRFVISSHNLSEIEDSCNEIVILKKGKIIKQSKIADLLEQENYLQITLDKESENPEQLFGEIEEIKRVDIDPDNSRRLLLFFNTEQPEQLQIRIIESLGRQNLGITDLSRGKGFANQVVSIFKGENPGN